MRDPDPADWAAVRFPHPLRTHQTRALEAIDAARADGAQRMWVVLPPGAGKTVVGLEAARRIGQPTIAFGPNTAIQSQWLDQWRAFTPVVPDAHPPASIPAGASRDLSASVTALTYQSLATFDPDAEVDEEGHEHLAHIGRRRKPRLLDRLHDNGRALVSALENAGPITLILDECHHLLEVWGQLLAELLEDLPHANVIGLTGTPPDTLTSDQARLVDELFGRPLYSTSVPSVVREGHLAPFAELAWFTTPTPTESQWLAAQAERFAELQTDLLGDSNATTSFLSWIDGRFVSRATAGDISGIGSAETLAVEWSRLEGDEPELAAAALRFHFAGLLALPPGAELREEHRHNPTAEDWVALLGDYVKGCLLESSQPGDIELYNEIKVALPSVGFQLTKRGIRRGRSPVDRVLARSEASTNGAVEILAAESGSLGDGLRALILCDHERATATLPTRLHGVLAAEAGSARLVLSNLIADSRTAPLEPVLITGRTVAAVAPTARKLAAFVAEHAPDVRLDDIAAEADGLVEITGSWRSRRWVPLVTRFYETGETRALVGTRALLGEGWDAKGVNTLIDLTTATTPTSVVQTRGRALRIDPTWPEKVANNWTVVCVSEEHPGGTSDWQRFVRKHHGYFGVTESGEIASGVGHVDPSLSPYEPPSVADFAARNAAMLERAQHRAAVRELWQVGTPYRDQLVHTIRIGPAVKRPTPPALPGKVGRPEPPALVPAQAAPEKPARLTLPSKTSPAGVTAMLGIAIAALFGLELWWLALPALGSIAIPWWQWRKQRDAVLVSSGRALSDLAAGPDPLAFAYAVADALKAAELSPRGAEGVRAAVEPDGSYRIVLDGVDTATSEMFTTALDEVLAPLTAPRHVMPRYIQAPLPEHTGALREAGLQWMEETLPTNAVVYHAVPTALSTNGKRRAAFAVAWRNWVSQGAMVPTSTPAGEGIVVTHRGLDPFAATTRLRTAWD